MRTSKLSSKSNKVTPRNCQKVYQRLSPAIVESLRSMLDPTYQIEQFMKKEVASWQFVELITAIQLINVCLGRKPSDGFVRAFKCCITEKELSDEKFIMHFATLLYLDPRNKLFRRVINNSESPDISAGDIIKLAAREIKQESYASLDRIGSDEVKIKGGSKKATVVRNKKTIVLSNGLELVGEMAFETTEHFYKQVFHTESMKNLQADITKYLKNAKRKDRARNILAYINYLLETKNEKLNLSEVATELKINRTSLYQIIKSLKKDLHFKHLLELYRKNNL